MPTVVFVMTKSKPDILVLTVDGVRYEYETSPPHISKFKFIYRKSPLKALTYIRKNSWLCVKVDK